MSGFCCLCLALSSVCFAAGAESSQSEVSLPGSIHLFVPSSLTIPEWHMKQIFGMSVVPHLVHLVPSRWPIWLLLSPPFFSSKFSRSRQKVREGREILELNFLSYYFWLHTSSSGILQSMEDTCNLLMLVVSESGSPACCGTGKDSEEKAFLSPGGVTPSPNLKRVSSLYFQSLARPWLEC